MREREHDMDDMNCMAQIMYILNFLKFSIFLMQQNLKKFT